jgi:hypothetical protein
MSEPWQSFWVQIPAPDGRLWGAELDPPPRNEVTTVTVCTPTGVSVFGAVFTGATVLNAGIEAVFDLDAPRWAAELCLEHKGSEIYIEFVYPNA